MSSAIDKLDENIQHARVHYPVSDSVENTDSVIKI